MATKEVSKTKSSPPSTTGKSAKGAKSKALSNDDKKKIKKKIRETERKATKVNSAQQSIPYLEMYKDGVCRVTEDYYTKTLCFNDINYQLAKNEDRKAIFQEFCNVHNYFDDSLSVQFTYMTISDDAETYKKCIHITEQDDEFNDVRREFLEMLQMQLEKGNNGLVRLKYLTIGITEKDLQTARSKLHHLEAELITNFKHMGVRAYGLNGLERLEILHRAFNPDPTEKFMFDWKMRAQRGLSTKDAIAPPSFNFSKKNVFQMGNMLGCTSYIDIISVEVSDRMLTEYLNIDENIFVNIHLHAWEHQSAVKYVKLKNTAVDAMKVDEQKKAARAGYDIDILPPDLVSYSDEIKRILSDLQSRNERFFVTTITVTCFAKTQKKLDIIVNQIKNITQKNSCKLVPLDWLQEDALMSAVPLGLNKVELNRNLTTSAAAVFIPFTTRELFQPDGDALYYGLNALSDNLIMADRKQLKNPNGLFLGTPGSGKSFAAKREISNVFLATNDDIIICDPEGEYSPLVNALHGQLIKISPNSTQYINPMDISTEYSDDDDPVSLKSDFLLSLCELVVGGKYGLSASERSVIDRCVKKVYDEYFKDPAPENMPILEDFYNTLKATDTAEAQHIAASLELYVTGSLNLFNHRTNIDIANRIVCFDIKEVGKNLRKLAMLIVQDQVWNRVSVNRSEGRSTRYYIDEFHLLLKEEQTASYSVEIWKRFRKWGGVPTGLTQNVKDFLASKEIENILDNSDFIYMLNQMSGDREILAEKLNISEHQLGYVTSAGQGSGLLFYGDTILPFVDNFPKDTKLYKLMTTKLDEQQ